MAFYITAETCSPQEEGRVTLVGVQTNTSTADVNAGIVRICRGGVWGTICADLLEPWSEKNAQVACRSALGEFSGALNPILHTT